MIGSGGGGEMESRKRVSVELLDALHGLLAIQEVARQFEFKSPAKQSTGWGILRKIGNVAIAHSVRPVT
jgi:hypothetical protein